MISRAIPIFCCLFFLLSGLLVRQAAFGDTSSELTRLNGEYRKAVSLAKEGSDAEAMKMFYGIIAVSEKLRSGLRQLPAEVTSVERTALSEKIARVHAKSERALSGLYYKNGDYKAVQFHFKKGMETLALFGTTEDNDDLVADYKYLGVICETNKDYMEAAGCYDTALRLTVQRFGPERREILGPGKDLLRVMKLLEQHESARNLEARLRKLEQAPKKP